MNKRTWIALVVFAVLLGIVFLTREQKIEVGIQRLEIPKFTTEDVVSIDITGANKAFLKKESGAWFVQDAKQNTVFHPADAAAVNSLLKAVTELKTDSLVTDNSSRHVELEVDEAKGTRLKVSTGNGTVVDLILGKSSQLGGVYIRAFDKPFVFTSSTALGWEAKKELKNWRLRQLTTVKAEDVTSISVRHADGSSIQLQKDGSSWKLPADFKLPEGFRFDSTVGDRTARQIAGLSAQEFLDEAGAPQLWRLEPPLAIVEASFKEGKNVKLTFGHSFSETEIKWANRLNQEFAKFDANSDGKILQDEIVASEGSSSAELKDIAAGLKQFNLFAKVDLGGKLGSTGDGAVTKEEVSSMLTISSLVPVKVDGNPQVFLITKSIADELMLRLNSLRDLALTSIAAEEIEKLEIAFKNTKVLLLKTGTDWKIVEPKKLPEGFQLGANQVSMQLNMLRNLKATRWVEGVAESQTGFARPSMTVSLIRKDGSSQKVVFGGPVSGPDGSKDVYVRGAMDKGTYVIAEYARARLEQGVELFRQRAPPSMNNISGMENLPPDVRAKLEAQLRQQFGQ